MTAVTGSVNPAIAMKIKFATLNTPLFREAGLNIRENWGEVDLDEVSPEARELLAEYTGRIVQVHPEDQDAFVAFVGRPFRDGKFVAAKAGNMQAPPSSTMDTSALDPGEIEPKQPQPVTEVPETHADTSRTEKPKRTRG